MAKKTISIGRDREGAQQPSDTGLSLNLIRALQERKKALKAAQNGEV